MGIQVRVVRVVRGKEGREVRVVDEVERREEEEEVVDGVEEGEVGVDLIRVWDQVCRGEGSLLRFTKMHTGFYHMSNVYFLVPAN